MKLVNLILAACFILTGCASIKTVLPSSADNVTDYFFRKLEREDRQSAYSLFAQGLSQRVSFDQFNALMDAIEQKWGRMGSEETVVLPFHERAGESDFIPVHVAKDQVKRYTYEVSFGAEAKIDFDLTLAPQNGQYKIIWLSVWGSTIYFTPEIRQKIEQLFSSPEDDGDTAPASGT